MVSTPLARPVRLPTEDELPPMVSPEVAASLTLPTQDDLICDDGIPMETQRHKYQMDLLTEVLIPWLDRREDGYVGGNMFLYFSSSQLRNQDFRGPDVFVVLGVPKNERKCWVVWEEGKAPDVIIELLSDSTANVDKTEKKKVYQERVRVPEYYWFDPFDPEDWAGFRLNNGVYKQLEVENGRLVSERLGLSLVQWRGAYRRVETVWLRWATLEGELLPTGEELAQGAQLQAELEHQRAEAESQRAERLAAQLRALGIEPES